MRTVTLAIDDLYLTRAERASLAARVHPLLATRGVPGTHDVTLGETLLTRLIQGQQVRLPRFDKARDDRLPASYGLVWDGPTDVVLFEGWCVGCPPEAVDALAAPINALERNEDPDGRWRRYVQSQLEGPYRAWFAHLDALVFLAVPSFQAAFRWRLTQERELAAHADASRSQVMDASALKRFMQHYERLTQHMLRALPKFADVTVLLGDDHGLCDLRWKRS